MRASLAFALVFLASLGGCTDNGVGRKCIIPNPDGGVMGTQISSPALECPSRLCLIQQANGRDSDQGSTPRSTCTSQCTTDDDCKSAVSGKASEGFCEGGFVCAVAVVAGA